ncbi:hypothetical protein JYG30_19720 [Fibrella sp. USSR17]
MAQKHIINTEAMTDDELHNTDPEDLEYWLIEVERSFNFKFAGNELTGIQTFGEFADHIITKFNRDHSDACTTQQAFYKIRSTMRSAFQVESLTPRTLLIDILPRKNRIRQVKRLEQELGFRLQLLEAPAFVTSGLFMLTLASLLSFIFSVETGIIGLVLSIAGFWLADNFGKELKVQTVGELVDQIARTNYTQSRRDSSTFNRYEIEKLLADWLCANFYLDRAKLTRESKFV